MEVALRVICQYCELKCDKLQLLMMLFFADVWQKHFKESFQQETFYSSNLWGANSVLQIYLQNRVTDF